MSTLKNVTFKARGLMPPVFTPLKQDLTVNYDVIPKYADFISKSGIKGVLVGGTAGGHMCLSMPEKKKLIEEWVKASKVRDLHVMVQVGGASMPDVLEMADFCAKSGADSILTLPETYFRPQNVTDLVDYVETVAKSAPNLPILYYHIPHMSNVIVNMPAFVSEATKRIPTFKGIKFSSNDLSEAAQVLRNLKDDQQIFLGTATLLAPAGLLGLKSSIGTVYNFMPKLALEIQEAIEKSDVEKARKLQEKLSLVIEALVPEGGWVPVMKAGMEIVTGIEVGPASSPQKPVTEDGKKRIEERLRKLGII
ncbi:N-acetylneuraminate lyase-like [Pieris napi]|uniref:N-acetylneuraminate lyase-like n=1 Tax=Pieris napi TaxID=78633 RepID=UPI001FBA6AD7|nr:N-acetylneuraminate lyase-like [Pieris napi]